ncbi:type III-A CRISPR-associated RAMP protein Csm5 [Calothrix sp. HK-06]|nr:type III-A CRISPR-associated RAMP protein Csm5 [Calothrix sp. HK-06]
MSSLAVQKPKVYESKRVILTSPLVRIGSSVSQLNPFEYVQTAAKVYLPDQELLAKALLQQGGRFFNDYIQAIDERGNIERLLRNALGDDWTNATCNNQLIFPKIGISQKLTDETITDLRPMIRNGMGQLYIPGSSIKGAIRTAIAYHLLKNPQRYQVPETKRVSEIETKLRAKLGELSNKHQQKFVDDDLFMDSLFTEYELTYQSKSYSGKSQNTDFLRCLKVSDSKPLIEKRVKTPNGQRPVNQAIAAEVIISSRYDNYLAKFKASIYAEMVRFVQTEFTLTLDTEMLSWFKHNQGMKLPFQNLEELLQICQEFTQEQWDYEHDYWDAIENNPRASGKNLNFNYIRDFYKPETCPYTLRLGWGSGMTGTTVGLCFNDELRAELRDICGIKAPGFEAPKSRRTIVSQSGEMKFVPGWVKFK